MRRGSAGSDALGGEEPHPLGYVAEVGGRLEERVEGLLVGAGLDVKQYLVFRVFVGLLDSLFPLGFEPGAELGQALHRLDGGLLEPIRGAAKEHDDV